MSVLSRIFRGEHRELGAPESYIEQVSEDGQVRMRRVPDTSMNAIAARWNAGMIYGPQNVPGNFATRSVIEVVDPNNPGRWVPVTGSNRGVPGMDAQVAALTAFRETGVIGPQPVNEQGSMAINGDYYDSTGSGGTQGGTETALPIAAAEVSQGGPSAFSQLLTLGQNSLETVFPSGRTNAFELSEFIEQNPGFAGAQTTGGANFLQDEAAIIAETPQSTDRGGLTTQATDDFLASEDAVIAQEGATPQAPGPAGETEATRRLRATQDRVRQMLLEGGLRTN